MDSYRTSYRRDLVLAARKMRREPTTAERILWVRLKGRRLGVKFRRQHPINQFIVDFCCLRSRLVIEVDGEIHSSQKGRDIERDRIIENLGYQVLRFTNNQACNETDKVIEIISSKIISIAQMHKN